MDTDHRWGAGEVLGRAHACIEHLLDLKGSSATRAHGLLGLCRFGAELVDASAAGHVRYDAAAASARLCLWRDGSPQLPLVRDQLESPSHGSSDWWSSSRSRRVAYEWIDQRHLAELPLLTDPAGPSLIVLGRPSPFADGDSELLSHARPWLVLLERLTERLLASEWRPYPRPEPHPAEVALTRREHEVLEMLGQGLLARSIAARLEVSERTVHKHLGSVYRKLDAHDRLLAVRRAESLGLIEASAPAPEPVPAG